MRHQRVLGAFVAACVGVATMVAGVVGASSCVGSDHREERTDNGQRFDVRPEHARRRRRCSGVNVESSGLAGTIDWQQLTTLSTQFDSDAVRQGRNVDPRRPRLTRRSTGTMVANWSLADLMVSFPGYAFPFDIGTIGLSTSGNCNLRFGGAAYVCHLDERRVDHPRLVADAGAVRERRALGRSHDHAAGAGDAADRVDRGSACGHRKPGAGRVDDHRPAVGGVQRRRRRQPVVRAAARCRRRRA